MATGISIGAQIGLRARRRREELGLTQAEVAERTGARVSQPEINKLERGRKPSPRLEDIRALENALGLPPRGLEVYGEPLPPGLAALLETPEGQRLGLTPDQITRLMAMGIGQGADPSPHAWYGFILVWLPTDRARHGDGRSP